MKRTRLRIATVAALIVTGVLLGAYFRGRARAERQYPLRIDAAPHRDDTEARARGRHLARSIAGCADSHGGDFGGQVREDGPVMTLVAPNLKRGQGGTRVPDAMPWQATRGMTDLENDAIWLSLRAAP